MANDLTETAPQGNALTVIQQHEIEMSNRMMDFIERAATNKDIDVAKLRELLSMKKDMEHEAAQRFANAAFARVCKAMPKIKKNGMIDFKKIGQKPIPYAKWEEVQAAIRPIYEAEGFNLTFNSAPLENGGHGLIRTAILTHENGIKFTSSIPLPLDSSGGKQPIQGMGSAASYGDRYTTKALFNLTFEGEDDDGLLAGVVFISDEQAAEISKLLEEAGSNKDAFLETFDAATVSNLQKANYVPALNMLHAKIRANAKKAGA